eukprot:4383972-Alexandrium_andersonii.AAC.1
MKEWSKPVDASPCSTSLTPAGGNSHFNHRRNQDWDRYMARCPRCSPQSAQGPSLLQSASIRNPPCRTCNIASGVRSLNCADPRPASPP